MNMNEEPTRDQLRLAARQLGQMLATVGDFYDVAEELAIGYAAGSMEQDRTAERSVALQIGALNELQSVANNVIEWRVDDARELLMSWSAIGDVLDMTKQAAQQRFGKKP